jgi:Nucleotidyl transferase AbiEii toxin, Type IV TA system
MPPDRLTPLQRRILRVLTKLDPPWTLTGGAALAGVYLGHRTTRDLDLFWRERLELDRTPAEAGHLLRVDGLDVTVLRTSPLYGELRVSDRQDVCVVDLVAEPTPSIEPPQTAVIDGTAMAVDSMHEILVNKLTALLGRTELRDLVDVQALLDAGVDLNAALRDAPKKDGGFSAMTLAWLLNGFEIAPLARALDWSAEQIAGLDAFRVELIDRLTRAARPE